MGLSIETGMQNQHLLIFNGNKGKKWDHNESRMDVYCLFNYNTGLRLKTFLKGQRCLN